MLVAPITSLFQRIANDATWPKRWKTGRVTALWKRSSKSEAKNYRPVIVLDCLSLCLERVLDPQLDNFIRKFIPDSQYGFRAKCGTQDYGVSLSPKLHEALEASLEAILIALDVAGAFDAFDKVWWAALLANLEHCGMSGKCLQLMKPYLSARFLYVVANGIASDTMEFFCGVPQGAIWSLKFWNFHMRELPSCLLHAESFNCNYADDSAILKVFGHSCATWSTDHFSRQTMDRHNAMCELNANLSRLIDFGVK